MFAQIQQAGIGIILTPKEARPVSAFEKKIRDHLGVADWGAWFVAEANDSIVGNIAVSLFRGQRIAHVGTLDMGVHPDYQGRGLGRCLIEAVLDWARDEGKLRRIELRVLSSNLRARALYESVGFEVEGISRGFLRRENGEYEDDLSMALLIREPP